MVYRPDIRNSFFDVVPMEWMTADERSQLGWDLHELVSDEATQDWLVERHLDGVVARHQDPTRSQSAVGDAYDKHLATQDDYYGVLVDGTDWIGMGSVMPSLPLRTPTAASGLLPARLTRATRYLSSPVITAGPNVTAWVGREHQGRLADVYGLLGEIAGNGAWTIEPVRSRVATLSIKAAGFSAVHNALRYDDMETAGTPPMAQLFERHI